MAKFRQIYTNFWTNAYIQEEMTAEDKYFYLYLLTNEQTKQIGVYQITKKQMAFDLGYSIESVNALVKRFEEHHKLIKYDAENREIVIIKWGGLNLNRGGKPVEDLIKKELLEVKNKGFLSVMLDDCPDNSLKKIIEDFVKAGEVEFMPSKDIRKRYIRLREKNQCFYTGKELEEYFDVSRIRVKSEGGGDQIYNLVGCSKDFNIDKTNLGLKAACIKNNIDITELKKKIEELKIFEEERDKNKISYREAIEKNIFDINTIRKYKNTNRKNENENITENDEVNKINNFYDTSAIKNKEQIINNNNTIEEEEKKNDPLGRIDFFFDMLIKKLNLNIDQMAKEVLIKNNYFKLIKYDMEQFNKVVNSVQQVKFINLNMREKNGNDRNFMVWITNNIDNILIDQFQDFQKGGKNGQHQGNWEKNSGSNEGKRNEYTTPDAANW